MAATHITVTQDNKVGNSDLLAIHSPVIFLVNVVYNGNAPEIVNAFMLENYKCILYADISGTERQFAFIANEPALSNMPDFSDFAQLDDTLVHADYATRPLQIVFFEPITAIWTSIYPVFCHATKQFGSVPNLTDVYNNVTDYYYAEKDKDVYVYFYSKDIGSVLRVGSSVVDPSELGYYRYKTKADSAKTIDFYDDGVLIASKTIIPIDSCEGGKTLKYLDSSGQYRFFPFNSFYQTYDNPSLIGTTNKFITSILTAQSTQSVIGYKNERKMDLTVDVDELQLAKLSDIYTSPKVYLYIGTTEDTAKDWLEVTVQPSQAIVRRRKGSYGRIDLTVTLPEYFTIKMI
jgi:hypothetical protein